MLHAEEKFRRVSKRSLRVAVEERVDDPGAWTVEAIDDKHEGVIFQATFYGPDAEDRAQEYAAFKYGSR